MPVANAKGRAFGVPRRGYGAPSERHIPRQARERTRDHRPHRRPHAQEPMRALAGDKVMVEMTPYDLRKGRITYRFKRPGGASLTHWPQRCGMDRHDWTTETRARIRLASPGHSDQSGGDRARRLASDRRRRDAQAR